MKGEWKDIASAPKDGRYLLLFGEIIYAGVSLMTIGCFGGHGFGQSVWCDSEGHTIIPTHWMELPLPPEIVSSKP